LTERDAELLRHFVQGAFDPLKTTTLAEDIVYTEKAQQKVAEILRRPSEGFIRFILEGIFPGRLTSKTVERFTPIIQKALQSAIVATVSKAVTEYEDAEIEITVEDAPRKTGVVTTQEELDFFAFVSTVIGQPLQYKDTINYFGILGDDGKGFVKVVCSSKSKSLGLNLALEEVQALLPGFQVGNAPKHLGCTRVYLTNLADPALAPLLLAAYKAR
jgi:hypothetical protein